MPPQELADVLVTNFIVGTGKPLRTVEESEFIKLVSELSKLKERVPVHCLSRKTLSIRINTEFETLMSNIKNELSKADYVQQQKYGLHSDEVIWV